MNWNGKQILVTGAGGFIGSHLVDRLVSLGARARAFVHYRSDGSWGWIDRSPHQSDIEVISGDLRDRDAVHRAVKGVDFVFHLGALIAIPYSYCAPASFVDTNINGTLNVLQAAREQGIERMVHTSTSETYGTAQSVPIREDHPLQAQSPYAASKIGADKLAESFHLSFDLPLVTLRPFNTFGPRQSARAIIPTIITQCLTDDEVHLGNVKPTRDFTYVADTVEGFIRAAACPEAVGRTLNIGSGSEITIEDLTLRIAEIIGKKIRIVTGDERVRPNMSEVHRLLADNTSAREVLGWSPSVSLEEGLKMTIDWLQDNIELYRPGAYVL